jgi:hypothetical protein
MPGNLMHVNATVTCPHGGQATVVPAQSRVLVSGQPVATVASLYTVAGCVFTVGTKPQPCVTVRWLSPSARIQALGSPVLLAVPPGICQSVEQIPQGPALVSVVQTRAVGE